MAAGTLPDTGVDWGMEGAGLLSTRLWKNRELLWKKRIQKSRKEVRLTSRLLSTLVCKRTGACLPDPSYRLAMPD